MTAVQQESSHGSLLLALRQMLPTAGQTLLLRAAMDGSRSAEAWATWRAQNDLKETLAGDHVGVKGLLPLLAFTLQENGVALDADDLSLLRMARYRESLRFERYHVVLQQVLATLAQAGMQAILLKGAALALSVYPQPDLRHCHDIDLLIQSHELAGAAGALLAQGFQERLKQAPRGPEVPVEDHTLQHANGLPVELHTRLLRNPFFDLAAAAAWQSVRPMGKEFGAWMLAPEWELVHIMGAMLCAHRRANVTWVCDATYLTAANPALDWGVVCEIAIESGLVLPSYVMLDYLRRQHQTAIPDSLFTSLQQNFAKTGRAGYEQLLQCVRQQRAAGYGEMLAAASSWQERALLWRWMLFPPPSFMVVRERRQEIKGWQLPYFYLRRGVRYLSRQVTPAKRAKIQAKSGSV